jgi:acyl carrier protein
VTVGVKEVQDLVAVQLGRRRVAAEDRLLEDLGARSLDQVNVVAALEDRYGIEIGEHELPDLRTVADLHRCVLRHLGEE